MLFIYSTSFDTTVDLLIHRLVETAGAEIERRIFRYNFDLWRDYEFSFGKDGFEFSDPAGRTIGENTLTKFLWRKPARSSDLFAGNVLNAEEAYHEEELWYALREVANVCWQAGKVVLAEPFVDVRVGKFRQLRRAAKYFRVPDYRFTVNTEFDAKPDGSGEHVGEHIVKSLTSAPLGEGQKERQLFTTRVAPSALDPGLPWMFQEYVEADADITVQFVRDEMFAFALDRSVLPEGTIDWREVATDETSDQWQVHPLPGNLQKNIGAFMEDLGLHFGRLDFLLSGSDYVFLEVNPNGQWAWLDAEAKHGLLDKVVYEINPLTPVAPLPVVRR